MGHSTLPNEGSASTTFEWKLVRIKRAPPSQQQAAPKAPRWRGLTRRDPRKPVVVVLELRGGAECWVQVKGRGSSGRYPGGTSIYDVVMDVNNAR